MIDQYMIDHYKAVLNDLEKQRADLDKHIEFIRNQLSHQADTTAVLPPREAGKPNYAGMSLRWAILNVLADTSRSLSTGEITQKLLDGGMPETGKRFSSNVSAVLSAMVNARYEVESKDGAYAITDHGQTVWNGIKGTPQYQARFNPSPSTT